MQATTPVTKKPATRLTDKNSLKDVTLGQIFTDHMLVAHYKNGAWEEPEIIPYGPFSIEPSLSAIHYGQSIFEGVKAYRNIRGEAVIFRPYDNYERFNRSALRMQMPPVPESIFIEGMRSLIGLDSNWIPEFEHHSLYIRPFMFATDAFLGVRPSSSYTFMIILSPAGKYYNRPMRIAVETTYTRAAPGGVGHAKNAGNYAACMKPTEDAKQKGYDQVLWTDALEHRWLQEVGTMNVFFVLKDKIITPSIEEATILDGVTRRSVLTILREAGYTVEERKISIHELAEAYEKGDLTEAFGTGTAATISVIEELAWENQKLTFDTGKKETIAAEVSGRLADIRMGRTEDNHGWMYAI